MVGSNFAPVPATLACDSTSSTKASRRQKTKKTHICKVCQKPFSRREHRARHELSHTDERPFSCRYCSSQYARKDLVTRHEKSLHANIYTLRGQHPESTTRFENIAALALDKNIKFMSQQNTAGFSGLEDEMDIYDRTTQSPLSPGSSDAQNSSRHRGRDCSDDNTAERFNLPLTPVGMELSDLSVDMAYSHSNGLLSPCGEVLNGNELDERHLASNQGGQAEALLDNSNFAWSHQGEPSNFHPHVDGMFNDLDFFTTMSIPASNEQLRSPLSNNLSNFGDFRIRQSGDHTLSQEIESGRIINSNGALGAPLDVPQISAQEPKDSANSNSDSSPMTKTIGLKQDFLVLDDRIRDILLNDLKGRLTQEQYITVKIPSAALLQRFLWSYHACFHHHFPIFHLPRMDLKKTPSPLILSICAIGALHRLERKHAACLQHWADKAIQTIIEINHLTYSFSPYPLWAVQCKLLLAFAKAFSGIPQVVRTALESLNFFSMEFNLRRTALEERRNSGEVLSWDTWSEIETSKRLLCGIFILNTLLSITFNTTPRMNMIPDTEIEMPDEDSLWEAMTAKQWAGLMASRNRDQRLKVIDAVNHVLFGKPIDAPNTGLGSSSFATSIVMHAINVHIWQLVQCTQGFAMFPLFGLDTTSEQIVRTAAISQVESILARCHSLVADRVSEEEQIVDESGVSRRSNGLALLRIAYVRATIGINPLNHMVLLSTNSEEIMREIRRYVCSKQSRTALVTKSAHEALGGLFTAVRAGTLLAMKTAAFKWSIDHAISDWDCALFVTRWIHSLECQQKSSPIDFDEKQILHDVIELLSDADVSYTRKSSLAAAVMRLWANFFDDTWVWGITPQIGAVMRAVAAAYENDWAACYILGVNANLCDIVK